MKYMKVRTMNGPRLLFFCVFIILGYKKEFCYNILSNVDIVPFSLIAFTICRYNSTNSSAAFSSVLWKGDSERKSIGELLAIRMSSVAVSHGSAISNLVPLSSVLYFYAAKRYAWRVRFARSRIIWIRFGMIYTGNLDAPSKHKRATWSLTV